MPTVLKTNDLTKDFGANRGIFDFDVDIKAGEIVGFVGPNGAGKSTTINLLAGLVRADKGTIELFGQPVSVNTIYAFMPRLGLLLSEPNLEKSLTPRQIFRQSQQLLNQDDEAIWQDMSKLLELDLDKPVKKLSLGNKKKVGIINALLHEPELIVMDEPTSGLDPIIQARFTQLLREAAKHGSAIFLSSHDLSEVQHVCDRVVIVREGHVILTDSTDDLLEQASKVFTLKSPPADLVKKIEASFKITDVSGSQHEVSFASKDQAAVIRFLAKEKFYDFYVKRPRLEEMFKEYYEK